MILENGNGEWFGEWFVLMPRSQSLDNLSLSKTHCCMATVRDSKGVTKESKYHGIYKQSSAYTVL